MTILDVHVKCRNGTANQLFSRKGDCMSSGSVLNACILTCIYSVSVSSGWLLDDTKYVLSRVSDGHSTLSCTFTSNLAYWELWVLHTYNIAVSILLLDLGCARQG